MPAINQLFVLIAIAFIAFIARFVIALFRGEIEVRLRIKKFAMVTLRILGVVIVLVVCMLSCFTQVSALLTDALSAEFISDARIGLKMVFGTESVLSAVQLIGTASVVMFGLLSCSACLYAVLYSVVKWYEDNGCRISICTGTKKYTDAAVYPNRKICFLLSRNLN